MSNIATFKPISDHLKTIGMSMGIYGCEYVDDVQPRSESPYCAIVCTTETVLAQIAGPNIRGQFAGKTLPAGTEILGYITQFQLTSGSVIAYFADHNLPVAP